MIRYKLNNGHLNLENNLNMTDNNNIVSLVSSDEFAESEFFKLYIHQKHKYSKYSKFEVHPDYIFSSLAVPDKNKPEEFTNINFYINKTKIVFVDNTENINKYIQYVINLGNKDLTMSKFLYSFFNSLIENDLIFIDKLEDDLSDIEKQINKKQIDDFNAVINKPKKKLFTFYRYYNHLLDIGENLENLKGIFQEDFDLQLNNLFVSRVERLKNEISYLKEYMIQLHDIYQTQINARQNDIMMVLTIVTTIVLPLSLIAGWYGMNFKYMPELMWQNGYIYVMCLSVAVVCICLIIFKKKNYF
jgi:mg2 transporter protein corA family protein